MRRALAALVLVGAAAAPVSAATVCRVADGGLVEISGLAAVPGGYVVAQDSGASEDYLVLDDACGTVASVDVEGYDNRDVEDLAVADGTVWLADIGDNRASRDDVVLVAVPLTAERGAVTQGGARVVRLRYPDGPRDAEALLLLPDGRAAVVTKTYGGVAGLYATPGPPTGSLVLERVGEVELPQASRAAGPIGAFGSSAVTGGAVSPDGRFVALRTYADVLVWRLLPDLVGTFAAAPVVVALPEEPQGEAVSFSADSRSLLVVSEATNPPVYAEPVPQALLTDAVAGPSPAGTGDGAGSPPAALPPALTSSPPGTGAGRLALLGGAVLVVLLAGAAAWAGRRD